MSETEAFGRRARVLSDPASVIELEAAEGKAELFAGVDALVADVVVRALRGDAVLKVERGRHADAVSIVGPDLALKAALDDLFAVGNQHSKGAWFLPEKASLKAGLVNLTWTFAQYPRFATGIAWEERA